MIGAVFKQLTGGLTGIVDRLVPDKNLAMQIKAEMATQLHQLEMETIKAQAATITAEATGKSWLQRNWRPITMLVFVGLVVARWLGFSAPGITEAVELKLLTIIQIGLGGYVVGRSAEKVAALWKPKP